LFGLFVLHQKVFIVKDVELAKQIMIAEFDSFVNYAGGGSNRVSDEIINKCVMYLKGSEWHSARNVL
jgi:hypothetical protein